MLIVQVLPFQSDLTFNSGGDCLALNEFHVAKGAKHMRLLDEAMGMLLRVLNCDLRRLPTDLKPVIFQSGKKLDEAGKRRPGKSDPNNNTAEVSVDLPDVRQNATAVKMEHRCRTTVLCNDVPRRARNPTPAGTTRLMTLSMAGLSTARGMTTDRLRHVRLSTWNWSAKKF